MDTVTAALEALDEGRWQAAGARMVAKMLSEFLYERLLTADAPMQAPLPLRLASRFAWLRRIPARIIGLGFRPEHVHTPEMRAGVG